MASHLSTPVSVLTAPPRTSLVMTPLHPTRRERRFGGYFQNGGKWGDLNGKNVPYERAEPRRGKRVKRHRELLRDFVEVARPTGGD